MGSARHWRRRRIWLLVTVFCVAAAGLAYELVAGTMATYLLGQSVVQFSFAVGWFLTAMGIGAYLSRWTRRRLLTVFLMVQVFLALVGGLSAAILFVAFAVLDSLYPVFFVLALVIGSAIGLEIPLLLRLIRRVQALRLAVSDVLTWDYLGAFATSLLFPIVLLPLVGLIRASLLFGSLNLLAGWITWTLIAPRRRRRLTGLLAIASLILLGAFVGAERLTRWVETLLYQDPIILARTTPYQRIVITRWKDDVRLYLDGDLQFSSRDEARYHESLVHVPVLLMTAPPKDVLILGGGDGLVAREVLKYPTVRTVTLVDLDADLVRLFRRHPLLRSLHRDALNHPKVRTVHADAFLWMKQLAGTRRFDLILADLPDPNTYALGKLYTVTFYLYALAHLHPSGAFATHATSPVYAPDAFWSIHATITAACHRVWRPNNCRVYAYHAYIPSFGDWGFIVVGRSLRDPSAIREIPVSTRFLTERVFPTLFVFAPDFLPRRRPVINRLNEQKLVEIYHRAWATWFD